MKEEISKIDAYIRAANYLSVGQLYLKDNPLLKRELVLDDVKKVLVGHFGTVPGQNFIYAHLNRVIKKFDLNMIYISGPGHGGQGMIANTYLEGSYTKVYPNITEDINGLKKLFKQFSFPGGVSSHVDPHVPGSINEGGELGYSLSHAYGAILDNPTLIAACVIGDGEAETGPLATSWHSNKFINPKTDGAVLPILHLNGYKIANPSVLDRIPKEELYHFLIGCGYKPYIVEGENIHEKMMKTLDCVIKEIKDIQEDARNSDSIKRPIWPMIVLRTPKGWTGPYEGSFKSHQVPLVIKDENDLKELSSWLKSYKPEELFTEDGKLIPSLKELVPLNTMGLNPNANGGILLKELIVPDFRKYGIDIKDHGLVEASDMMELGNYIREVVKLNDNFRIFGPDEALSNRLNHVFEVTNRQWVCNTNDNDEFLATNGKVMDSMLSEHLCQGWLEGYLLTGRHGFMHSYEAFIRIIDSMASQHAKWLKVSNDIPWRREIASLNYILTSHIWQQDHNGYTHQDPGFLNHLVTKKADIVRIYLPPDANCLISCFDHCIKSKNYINTIVASKHLRPQWLSMDEAVKHCTKGIGIFKWASNDEYGEPDIVMACCGDTPTLETLAAVKILKVDLMRLQSNLEHPHGLTDTDYNALFTTDKPIIFAFHGYPNLIHQLIYKRRNKNIHVHGYKEEGTITTPFDMRVQNELDRFHLVIDAVKYLDLGNKGSSLIEWCKDKLIEHDEYISENGIDLEEIRNWKWKE